MPIARARRSGRLAGIGVALAVMLWAPGPARADWTTYRGDATRSGVDSSSVGSLPFAPTWTSQSLGGAIWGQPLVHDGLVIVATESDQVWALSESTGQMVWQAGAGTPVPSSGTGPHPPCGDISPTVGITSTPVIDPATNRVFVVADTLNGGTIQHQLYAFNLSDGSVVPGFPVNAEPPGDVPADQLQRPGLALDNGQVIIGYGGNDGDCGSYHGWLVSIPETGGALRSFEVDQSGSQGAIWGAGNAPPVDSTGDVWAATGNGNSAGYDYSESVLKLDSSMNLLDHWAPSDWQSLDSGDADIGSSAPVLLPGGLVFEIGKQGIGYLLSASSLGGVGAPRYQASVCSGSWGGGIYFNGVIYFTCSNGLRALALNAAAATFAPVSGWQVNSAVNGPPTVAGGLVWATDWTQDESTLYGLNLQTGQTVVKQATPGMEHFTTPSASDGKLFLATGQTVESYTIANPASPPVAVPGTSPTPSSPAPATCALRLRSNRVKIHHPRRRERSKHAPPGFGTVAVIANCSQVVQVRLSGTVTVVLGKRPRHGKSTSRTVHLATVHATLEAGVATTMEVRLGPSLIAALEHRTRESGAFRLISGGSVRARARARLRL